MSRPFSRHLKIRAAVAACSLGAAVTFGTLFGATLKTEKQKLDDYNKFQETPSVEKIAILEEHKSLLMKEKATLEKKLADFQKVVREREAEKRRLEIEWQRRSEEWFRYDQEQQRKVAKRRSGDEAAKG